MFVIWQLKFLTWPDWIRMLTLIALTVATLTITVFGLAWVVSLIN